jgi:hypothetical protein
MTYGAISQAIQILVDRRDDATIQIAELTQEVAQIDAALLALNGPSAIQPLPPSAGIDPKVDEPTGKSGESGRVSVRLVVQQIMESEDRTWLPVELVNRIMSDMLRGEVEIKVSNLGNAVRTALWGLRQDGVVCSDDEHRHRATKWVDPQITNKSTDSADETGVVGARADRNGGTHHDRDEVKV